MRRTALIAPDTKHGGVAVFGTHHLAHLNLIFENVPANLLRKERGALEDLFVESYNKVSGMCDGLHERILLEATSSLAKEFERLRLPTLGASAIFEEFN